MSPENTESHQADDSNSETDQPHIGRKGKHIFPAEAHGYKYPYFQHPRESSVTPDPIHPHNEYPNVEGRGGESDWRHKLTYDSWGIQWTTHGRDPMGPADRGKMQEKYHQTWDKHTKPHKFLF